MQQRVPKGHYTAARKKWYKEENTVVIECYYRVLLIRIVFLLKGIDSEYTGID